MLFCFLVLMANCLSFIFHAQVGSEAKGHHLNLMTLFGYRKKNIKTHFKLYIIEPISRGTLPLRIDHFQNMGTHPA